MNSLKEDASLINRFMGTSQVNNLLAEECGELIQSVMKLQRFEMGDKTLRVGSNKISISVDEEIADVLICIERIQDKLQNYERVDFFINQKIDRIFNNIRNILETKVNTDVEKEG